MPRDGEGISPPGLPGIPATGQRRGHRVTVLFVEDTVGAAIKRVLEKLGFVVLLATDGESAWEILDEAEIDLVRKIRGMPRYEDPPIVMISGRAAKRDIVEAIEAGITTYIAKPFSVGQLRDKVEEVLGRSDAVLTQRLLRVCRNQDELSSHSEHSLVLFAEASNTYAELAQPHSRKASWHAKTGGSFCSA